MKNKLHKLMALVVVSLFTMGAWAQEDYTSSIKNAEMTTLDNWTHETEGSTSYGDGLVKIKAGKIDFYQTITLPAGKYKMTVKAAYRYAGGDVNVAEKAEYDAIQAGVNTHLAKVYAQTATYKYEGDVQNRWEGRSETDLYGNLANVSVIEHEGVTYYVPNSSAAVMAWFNADKYVNELVFNVQEEGEVKIGIGKTETAPDGEYTNIGAWTLTRLGDAEADPKEEEPTPDPEEIIFVDMTAKVGTSKADWNATGGPVNIDGISMPEMYEKTTETLGDVLWQTVTGLENGTYTVELWANARYTPGRGFDSEAADGALDFTYLYANNVEISIEVYHNGDLNKGKSYKLEGVEVTDGTLKMGMTKKGKGSNWHTIQIKSLAYRTSANAALNMAKEELKAALETAKAVSPAVESLTAAIAKAQGVYDNSTSKDEVENAIGELEVAIILANNTNAVAGATIANPVVTNFVLNGTFDTNGVTAPWKTTTGAQNQTTATNQQGAFTGNFYENWNPTNYSGKIYQVIENIPNGLYELSICAFVSTFDASAQFVYANADKKALVAAAPTAYTVRTVVENNTIEIGFEQTAAVNGWSGIDNVSLKYFGLVNEDYALEIYKSTKATAEALKGKKMSLVAREALEKALAVEVDETDDEALLEAEAALQEAITAAQASVDLYASNKLAIDAMYALMESTNVYTAEAYEAYSAKAADFLAQYEADTLTATVDNPATVHGWRADVDYDVMLLSAFGAPESDWDNLHINTWSVEGETDGSEFKVPFYEYWTGDGNSLGTKTFTATMTGLKPGQYYGVEAWVRVSAKEGVAAADATGITLSVGEGEPVDITEGEAIGETRRSHAVFTAYGYADAEGKLTINFNVLEGNNISWLSFKNLQYTEEQEGTGIEHSELNTQHSAVIYDLSGRRVEKAVKGIYIVNGKKVVK